MPSTWPQLISVACTYPSAIFKALQMVPRCGQGQEPRLQGFLRFADRSTSTPGNHSPPLLLFTSLPFCSTALAKLNSVVDDPQAVPSAYGPASVPKRFSRPKFPPVKIPAVPISATTSLMVLFLSSHLRYHLSLLEVRSLLDFSILDHTYSD